MRSRTAEVLIVGAGIVGSCTAYYLARRGVHVALVDARDIASGTSGSCDRAVMMQSKKPGPMLQMALASARLYEHLSDDLDADVEYDRHGGMILIETAAEYEAICSLLPQQRAAGVDVQLLDRDAAIARQPAVSPHILGATYWDGDGAVNPLEVCFAMVRAARRCGAAVLVRTEVRGFLTEGHRVVGAQTSAGDIRAEKTIIAAGVWSPMLGRLLDLDIPIIPRKGHILVTERLPRLIRSEILSGSYIMKKHSVSTETSPRGATDYGVGLVLGQTRSGNLLIGGSREFAGYDVTTSCAVLHEIAHTAVRLFPVLAGVALIRAFAGLRPFTRDGKPILGAVPERPGLYLAAGHEGDGIALGPITGQIMADVVTLRTTGWDLSPFVLSRFQQPVPLAARPRASER
jgi:sarcosine oxidase subunit beta